MKPIEPGCLVMVVRGEHAGRTGIAEIFVGADVEVEFHLTDGTKRYSSINYDGWSVRLPSSMALVATYALIRIDDYDPSQDVMGEDIKRIVTVRLKLV